jgi:hypothetical protein
MIPAPDGLRTILLQAPAIGTQPSSATDPADWGIYVGEVPTNIAKDRCIVINEVGSSEPPHPSLLLNYPAVQVLVRSAANDYQGARQKIEDVKDRLLGCPSQDVSGDRYISILMTNDVMALGRDERRRPIFTTNWHLIVEPALSTITTRTPVNAG